MFKSILKLLVVLVFISLPIKHFGQALGCWNSLNISYDNGKKWSFSSEAQLRFLQFYKNYNYHEYKGIVGYKLIPIIRAQMTIQATHMVVMRCVL